jgi:3-oxoacyl-[acyl-carrier protein] reductase
VTDTELRGVRVVVTGSTQGLGEAVARDLAAGGARVVVNGRNEARCREVADTLVSPPVPGSVADETVAQDLVDCCVNQFGGIDAVVNNAGFTRDAMLSKMSAQQFDDVVAVHLRGCWLLTKVAAKAMRTHGGSIVNVVSGTALYGHIGQANYAAAKGGVLGLTRAMSMELRRFGIRVNAVAPMVRTEMIGPLLAKVGEQAEVFQPFFGAPEDVAPVFAYLCSPMASGINGQVLSFDGNRLSVWSHPEVIRSVHGDGRFSIADVASAVAGGDLATLNPDALGRALHELFGFSLNGQ